MTPLLVLALLYLLPGLICVGTARLDAHLEGDDDPRWGGPAQVAIPFVNWFYASIGVIVVTCLLVARLSDLYVRAFKQAVRDRP